MAFILILSPNNAPPVFRLEGSTDTIAIFLFGKSMINYLGQTLPILQLVVEEASVISIPHLQLLEMKQDK